MPRKTVEQRLSNYTVSDDGCWNWQGALVWNGYGHIAPLLGQGRAHRASFVHHNGPIGEGQFVLHKCDNRRCINPEHLELGSQSKNIKDAYSRGRMSGVGAANANAKLTAEQVEMICVDKRIQAVIALDYGVGRSTIGEIKRGRNWQSREANARAERKM